MPWFWIWTAWFLVFGRLVFGLCGTIPKPKSPTSFPTPTMHSFEEWVRRLENKSLVFLTDQQKISGMNGKNHDDAIAFLVKKKKFLGEKLPSPPRPKRVLSTEEDDDYIIEHIPSGPKGQTTRVKTPRCVYTS